jgi:hypothetical protein
MISRKNGTRLPSSTPSISDVRGSLAAAARRFLLHRLFLVSWFDGRRSPPARKGASRLIDGEVSVPLHSGAAQSPRASDSITVHRPDLKAEPLVVNLKLVMLIDPPLC